MLKTNGKLVLTVPSHMWLWNRADAVAGHKIRYTKNLTKLLNENGFKVNTARYFFIFILPLLLLRTVIHKDTVVVKAEEYKKGNSMNYYLSSLLLISRIENKLNKFMPNLIGGSLFIIATKK